jgi:hypothetical protein
MQGGSDEISRSDTGVCKVKKAAESELATLSPAAFVKVMRNLYFVSDNRPVTVKNCSAAVFGLYVAGALTSSQLVADIPAGSAVVLGTAFK